jgi:hypothetical protein
VVFYSPCTGRRDLKQDLVVPESVRVGDVGLVRSRDWSAVSSSRLQEHGGSVDSYGDALSRPTIFKALVYWGRQGPCRGCSQRSQ